MMRRRAPLLILALAVTATACAAKRTTLVVLLPEPEDRTTVGRATVENAAGSVDLTTDRDATRVNHNQRPRAVSTMSDRDVQRTFGAALAALPPATRHFVLNFRFDSDELTEQSRRVLPEIVATVRERPAADVIVIGHTDTMGAPQANYALGLKRAATVRTLLIKAGLDPSRVDISSLGETDPLVRTGDNTPEARNRRVEIAVR